MNLEPLEVHQDNRGAFVEAFKLPNDGQLSYVIAKHNETRGNHYHTRKTEHFLVVSGVAEMEVKDRESGNIMRVTVTGTNPIVVTVVPNHTHNITAKDGNCLFMIWCDEQFNPDDPDTYAEEV
jgi:dTDP-4-dehydrorhamnose 3,5-epimerase and related enzymes